MALENLTPRALLVSSSLRRLHGRMIATEWDQGSYNVVSDAEGRKCLIDH